MGIQHRPKRRMHKVHTAKALVGRTVPERFIPAQKVRIAFVFVKDLLRHFLRSQTTHSLFRCFSLTAQTHDF